MSFNILKEHLVVAVAKKSHHLIKLGLYMHKIVHEFTASGDSGPLTQNACRHESTHTHTITTHAHVHEVSTHNNI